MLTSKGIRAMNDVLDYMGIPTGCEQCNIFDFGGENIV